MNFSFRKLKDLNISTFYCTEYDILANRLRIAEEEILSLRGRTPLIVDYERQLRRLRDEVTLLSGRRAELLNR